MSEYNGWTNKETWLVTLWLMPELLEYITDMTGDGPPPSMQNIAKQIEEYVGTRVFHNLEALLGPCVGGFATRVIEPMVDEDIGGLASDLLRMCLHDVDWYEIAEHVWEDLP